MPYLHREAQVREERVAFPETVKKFESGESITVREWLFAGLNLGGSLALGQGLVVFAKNSQSRDHY